MGQQIRSTFLLCILLVTVLLTLCPSATTATDVKWTSNPEDTKEGNSGPLPLSSKQRQQLLQLEQVIQQSPNPDETLLQAAQANGMSPQDLMSMLQRNRSDLEQGLATAGGGGGMSKTVGGALGKLITTLFALLTRSASTNPKAFAVFATLVLLLLVVSFSVPRTGLVISNQRGILSRGPTTVFQPPTKFLEKRLLSSKWQQRDPKSSDMSSKIWTDLGLEEDGSTWHSLPRKSEIAKAASAQITIPIKSFIEEKDGEDENEDEAEFDFTMDLCYNHAVDVLTSRQLTEYAPQKSVRLHTFQQQQDEGLQRFAVLVVKKLGDWGRYGLVPLLVTRKNESDEATSLTLSTLRGAPFTGQIHVSVEQRRPKEGGDMAIVIMVHLAIPRKANKIARKVALKIVDTIASSVASSVKTRTRQSIARRAQSTSFQGKAKERAVERRQVRHKKELEMEEMAEDRRRRWQRNNPDAGRWRPSGDRMKSPNNC